MIDLTNDQQPAQGDGDSVQPTLGQNHPEQRWVPIPEHCTEDIAFRAELIAKGHVLVEDEDGFIDEGAYREDTCEGPMCMACGQGFCVKCWAPDNPIAQCVAASNRNQPHR